jgi:hypothetical protein
MASSAKEAYRSLSRPKGCPPRLSWTQNNERASSASRITHTIRRHRQIAGKPTRPSNTKRLADKAPVARVTTLGMVKASRGEALFQSRKESGSGRSAAKSQPLWCTIAKVRDAVHRLHGGGSFEQKGLRYSRASLATGQETSNYAGLTLTVP